ncbi:hypothetical protein [Roseimicrobium sp. ORNL1]|uniref:hypothetical protein n=1 Tax=Roseimicrobium sp. ORNL1 TaxID=2711231 RepID=UPI0013E192DC|nr:hypothetical protein [Roseimicrobium sp. ORNL1]QIF03175.1 hypothetical protein G5S37_17150 [Roseimicrobium sp. ORNL1]
MNQLGQPSALPPQSDPATKKGRSIDRLVTLALSMVSFVILMLLFLGPLAMAQVRQELNSTRPLSAKADMLGLEQAIKGYRVEYNRLPALESPPPLVDNAQGYNTTSAEGRQIIEILVAKDTKKNPRQITFYEPPVEKDSGAGYNATKGLKDIWGSKGYIILLDYDGDGLIADPAHRGSKISGAVLVYSAGPDGDYTTWHDNITSWER